MLLLYVPSIIFLVNYLMPYFNAHKAGELTGTIFKMDSLKKNLVKNGRECLIGAMLLFHFAKKVFEFLVFHTHTSLPHTNGFSGLMKGVHQLAFCFIITTFSVRQTCYFPNYSLFLFYLFYYLVICLLFSQLFFSIPFCLQLFYIYIHEHVYVRRLMCTYLLHILLFPFPFPFLIPVSPLLI